MLRTKKLFSVLLLVVLLSTSRFAAMSVSAAAPASLNYQTELKTSDGTPVTSATTVQFSFYNHPTNGFPSDTVSAAGPLLWTERYNQFEGPCAQVTPDGSGAFSLALGSCTPFPDYLDFSDVYYLGIKVEDNSEAAPRLAYSTAPFAVSAGELTGIRFADTPQVLELGTSGLFEDDAAVIIGADSGFAFVSGTGPGDLRVVDDFEVGDAGFIGTNLVVGAATTISETLENAGFVLDGDELFVAGNAGIEGTVFSDTGFVVGASTTYADGEIESSGTLTINDSNNQEIKTGTGLFTVGGDLAITGGDITSSATTFNFDIGNTGVLNFRDGTNTLAAVKDQGDYGFFNIDPKSTTGDPTTCAVGDIYVNSVDGTIKGCTATNTWSAMGGTGGSSLFTDAGTLTYLTSQTDDFALGGTDSSAPFFFDESAEELILTNTTTGLSFRVNDQASDTTPFVIDASGNVGIGTAAPAYKLDISSGAATALGLNRTAAGQWIYFTDGTDTFGIYNRATIGKRMFVPSRTIPPCSGAGSVPTSC